MIMALVHASCVNFKGKGILILGKSGSGKSDLALRLIDAGGTLVSDDYVEVVSENNTLMAKAAPNIAGMIEVRGIGLIKIDFLPMAQLDLALDLVPRNDIERLPEQGYFETDNIQIPLYGYDGFCASAIAKINLIINNLV